MLARGTGIVGTAPEIEDRRLAEAGVLLGLLAEGSRGRERLEHAATRRAGRVERPALDQALHRPLVDGAGVHSLAEIPDRGERAALLPGVQDRLHGDVADVLYGVEAEADAVARDDEAVVRGVDVRR